MTAKSMSIVRLTLTLVVFCIMHTSVPVVVLPTALYSVVGKK